MNTARTIVDVIQPLLGTVPVELEAWDGSVAGTPGGPRVVLRSRRALRTLLWSPNELGLARAYISGDLDVRGDLGEALSGMWRLVRGGELRTRRPGVGDLASMAGAALKLRVLGPPPKRPEQEARLRGRLHSMLRDRRAIAHHYDLSNDFYQLLLDPSMAYSCGYWSSPDATLEQAQHAKLDLICTKLGLAPGMRLLDIGCGWGSLVIHAAKHYGVRVLGVTLSAQQRAHVQARIDAEGLGHLVTVRQQDYRELPEGGEEPFDAISSIEMGEHVGEDNYPTYTRTMFDLLAPGGRLLLQQMSRGRVAPGGGAFIESYIAPDMTMRLPSATIAHLERAGFELRDVHALREHYVLTIDAWADTLERYWTEFVAMVGPAQARIWRLYLVGGSLAFAENRMGVDQFLLVRPTVDGVSGLPLVREQVSAGHAVAEG